MTGFAVSRSMQSADSELDNWNHLVTILASQRAGKTCLPNGLGLSEHHYEALCKCMLVSASTSNLMQTEPGEDLRQQLLELRRDEWIDLRNLLEQNRNQKSPTELWMAEIVAAACLGGDHLWRDLGLPNRTALRELLEQNFALLANRNIKDMKWKKYFYKQLCEQEGGYVCRAPSCEQCAVYEDCFGPED